MQLADQCAAAGAQARAELTVTSGGERGEDLLQRLGVAAIAAAVARSGLDRLAARLFRDSGGAPPRARLRGTRGHFRPPRGPGKSIDARWQSRKMCKRAARARRGAATTAPFRWPAVC